jgi:endogenous inhibitor of DNA gyrase (YacG/DUF329 family)
MSGVDEAELTPRERGVTCPACGAATRWAGNPNRPFCSLSCRLVDLGVWLDERYRIAGRQVEDDDPDVS